ncbi:MAG: matrixin family metalloprotease [Pseudomonadota bacterium]
MPRFTGGKWGAPQRGKAATVTWSLVGEGVEGAGSAFGIRSGDNRSDNPRSINNKILQIIQDAFDSWSDTGAINFVRVRDDGAPIGGTSAAEIRIAFGSIDGGGNFFGGNTLGLAFEARGDENPWEGDILIDSFDFRGGRKLNDLKAVITHEIGHAIGLDHVFNKSALMHPVIGDFVTPQADDAAGIRKLYGSSKNGPFKIFLDDDQPWQKIISKIDGLQIIGGNTANLIRGGAGAEIMKGRRGDDTLKGGGGDDRLLGLGHHDLLQGGRGDDLIKGGAGFDILSGGLGQDTLIGGPGEDRFVLDRQKSITDLARGFKVGTDRIDVSARLSSDEFDKITITQTAKGAQVSFFNKGGLLLQGVKANRLTEDSFFFSDSEALALAPGSTSGAFGGGSGQAGGGSPIAPLPRTVETSEDAPEFADIQAGETLATIGINHGGKVVFVGGNGSETVNDVGRAAMGPGNDTINAGVNPNGPTHLAGESGADQINGGNDDDLIDGGSGNDTLWAGNGNDTIYTGSGVDLVDGGAGNDLIIGDVDGSSPWSQTDPFLLIEPFIDDTLRGGDGDDTISGSGNLSGGRGSDRLIIQGDAEISRGDFAPGDRDTFVFEVDGAVAARISDFDPNLDRIDLSAMSPGDDLAVETSSGGTKAEITFGESLIVVRGLTSALSVDDLIV